MQAYDYIVIGAGSAGCVLASRLTEQPGIRVLLLEAGPPADDFWIHTPAGMGKLFLNKRYNWSYFTEPIPTMRNRRLYWPRGKTLGGTSSINGMVYLRGHPLDFDHWRDLGNTGWGYEDVLPYFRKLEHNARGGDPYRGTDGPVWISDPAILHPSSVDFVKAARSAGIPFSTDLNGELHDGVGYLQHNIRNGKRQSAYVAYIEPVRHRRNLVVKTGAHVERLLIDGHVATGVQAVMEGERRQLHATREVILAAGALNSPQLLMLSGIGEGAALKSHGLSVLVDLPGVGRNLQDHFYVHSHSRSTPESSYNRALDGARKYLEGIRYLATRKSYLSLGSSQAGAFVKSDPEQEYGDLQISFRPMTHRYYPDGSLRVDPYPAISTSVYRVRPDSVGYVALRSRDPSDAPAFVPNYLTAPEDVRAMLSGLRIIRKIVSQQPLASRILEELTPGPKAVTDEQLLEFMQEQGNCAFHPAGTCKMGRDRMAVVDERLRVRGVERLRVIDASIMPRVTSGNTNAPSMMIGEKGAAMVAEDALAPRPLSQHA